MGILQRQIYFDKTIHIKAIKDCISGENEERVIKLLKSIDFELDVDYKRQYPIGNKFVLDFAFIKEKVAIEADGENHERKKQKIVDKKRDKFLLENNWLTIRVRDKDLFGSKGSFWKFLIKEVIEERRKQYEGGRLSYFDIMDYKDENYD